MAIGLSFAGVLAWLGVSGGNYLAEASAISLAVATSGLVVAGLARLMGAAGVGVGALLLVIVGNPLSGIATSPRLLPGPWGEFGQWLPTGAGGTLLRTAAYFPEASVAFPVWVLLGWAVLGAGAVLIGRHRGKSPHETPAIDAGRHEVVTVLTGLAAPALARRRTDQHDRTGPIPRQGWARLVRRVGGAVRRGAGTPRKRQRHEDDQQDRHPDQRPHQAFRDRSADHQPPHGGDQLGDRD